MTPRETGVAQAPSAARTNQRCRPGRICAPGRGTLALLHAGRTVALAARRWRRLQPPRILVKLAKIGQAEIRSTMWTIGNPSVNLGRMSRLWRSAAIPEGEPEWLGHKQLTMSPKRPRITWANAIIPVPPRPPASSLAEILAELNRCGVKTGNFVRRGKPSGNSPWLGRRQS